MKVQILLPISIAVSVVSFSVMKIRVKELVAEEKKDKQLAVKLRVIQDILSEYEHEKKNTESNMQAERSTQEQLQKEISETVSTDAKKGELEACVGLKKSTTDEVGSLQEQQKTFEAESTKEKTAWEAEMATLKEKLNAPSPICNYLKPGSPVQGLCPMKIEEPKAEPPKPQDEKKEPPKEEKKEAEPSKQEAPQQEAPQQEAPKQEAPKQEAPKQEAPKQEAPKQEAPKQETLKK